MKKINFWYESNAFFGRIESIEELNTALKYQLDENNSIYSIDEFLDKSMKIDGEGFYFGTRREHTSSYSLRMFLVDNELLDIFINYHENKIVG